MGEELFLNEGLIPSFNMKNIFLFFLFLGFVHLVSAQSVTLIGPGLRNGDFNDDTDSIDKRTFDDTPFWENVLGNQTLITARTNQTNASGTRNAQINQSAGQLLGQSTGHVIAVGDSFGVSYEWRDAFNWTDATDRIRISLFVTSDDTITGERTVIGSTDSPLSTINNTYEAVVSDDFYIADATYAGKVAFVSIDASNVGGGGFARLDDFVLTVGEQTTDPLLKLEQGDLVFGDIVNPPGGAGTTRTLNFKNLGIANNLTLSSIALSAETDSVFTITSAPANGAVIAPGGAFIIEVTANGGADFTDYAGALIVTTNPADQAVTLPISANISSGNEIFETSSTILVDYDDGIANGIHEMSIRNGGFEEGMASQTFVDTPVWSSAFSPEGDSEVGTLSTSPATGLYHSQASGFVAAVPEDERVQPTQTFALSDWTIAQGDTLTVEFSAKAGLNWDNANMQVIVEVRDESGMAIFDPVNGDGNGDRWAARPAAFTGDGSSYETFVITTPEVQRNSPWISHRPRIRFLTLGGRTSFVDIDNVSITGNTKTQITDPSDLVITVSDLVVDPLSQDITIRFKDVGATTYKIESSQDLDFTSGVVEFPLDGSEDRATFPGEISFTFEDYNLVGPKHFWRVSTN